jgi:hypothetical protein
LKQAFAIRKFMDFKAFFGLTVIPEALFGACLLAVLSQRVRDVFFVLLVCLTPMMEWFDVHYVSRAWYRGTALGYQVSVLDILAVALVVAAVVAPRRGQARLYWPPGLGLPVLFFLYCCLSVAISHPQLFGLFELWKMVRGYVFVFAVALYLRSEHELRLFVISLALLVAYEGTLGFRQRYLYGFYRVPGTVDDANSLSMLLCLTTPVLVGAINSSFPRVIKALLAFSIGWACLAEVLTISRTGIVTLVTVLLTATAATISWRVTVRKVVLSCLIALAAAGVAAKSWHTVMSRFDDTNLRKEYADRHEMGRGYYLRVAGAILREHWLGVGLNNWSYWVSDRYGPRLGYYFVPYRGTDAEPGQKIPSGSNVDEAQAAPAHCLGALTAGELGYPGLALFALVWARWFWMGGSFLWPRSPRPMRRLGVGLFFGFCGIFLQSLTEWVFRQSPIYFQFHILLGALASLYYLKRQVAQRAPARELVPSPAFPIPAGRQPLQPA